MRRFGLLLLALGPACEGGGGLQARVAGDPVSANRAAAAGGPERLLVDPDGGPGALLGASVALPGDVDGDGYDDVVAGAWGEDDQAGAVHLFFGGPPGPVSDAHAALRPVGLLPGDRFGSAVAGAGDLDEDGRVDFIVGAPGDAVAGTRAGAAWRISGDGSGEDAVPLRPEGLAAGDGLGRALAGGGDLDGDGLSDVILGAFGDDGAGRDAGAVWVLSAGEAAFAFRLQAAGLAAGDWLGTAVASAGDVDGDGYADLLAGAPGTAGGGAAWFWPGGAAGPRDRDAQRLAPMDRVEGDAWGTAVAAAGDVDGDGFPDLAVGAPGQGGGRGAVWLAHGGSVGPSLGASAAAGPELRGLGAALAAAGDLDGDGLDDLLIGAPATAGGAGLGLLWMGAAVRDAAPALLALSAADLDPGDGQGISVAGASDLDGDGHADIVLGRYGDDARAAQAGAVAWYRGCGGEDADADGVCADADCDDTDPAVGAGWLGYRDNDGDGFGDPATARPLCATVPGWVDVGGDCDDDDASAAPGGEERPGDGVDGDCDGREWCAVDRDGDGHSSGERVESADTDCDDPYEAHLDQPEDDCDDLDPAAHPGAPDLCGDGVDSDCDGAGGAEDDEDGDGLPTQQEWARGTDPCNPDSDGDGLNDLRDPQPLSPPASASDPGQRGRCGHLPRMPATALGLALLAGLFARSPRRR